MIIDVIDLADSTASCSAVSGFIGSEPLDTSFGIENNRAISGHGTTVIRIYGMSNGAEFMIGQIIQATGGRLHSIDVLRLWGHGAPGAQAVSMGLDWSRDMAGISGRNIGAQEPLREQGPMLARLRDYFVWGAHAELHGCNVGQHHNGREFLRRLARLWGVPVQAGAAMQYGGCNWRGPVIQANPNGRVLPVRGTRYPYLDEL